MDTREFPLSSATKRSILQTFFDYQAPEEPFENHSTLGETYFNYYQRTLQGCKVHSTTRTHRDIIKLVGLLKRQGATQSSVQAALQEWLSDQNEDLDLKVRLLNNDGDDIHEAIQDSINLAVRLLLMISIGPFLATEGSITVSGETNMSWKNGGITDLIASGLSPQRIMEQHVKLEKVFNARNLERIAGIEIRWTSNLYDHLRMRDDDTAVEIFHYTSFLKMHQHCHIPLLDWQVNTLQTHTRPVYPPGLIKETLRTLALLLPEHDKDVKNWFAKQQQKIQKRGKVPLDPRARECGQLKVEERQIGGFSYWHDRLVILKQAFDEAEPSGMHQWWHDRRRRVQWYTFWVAAMVLGLTVFFGLVQSVEGGIQVYYAARSSG